MKKKITLILLALLCALCCTFGLAACDNENNKPKPDNEPPADTHQVSAYEWGKAFANVTKFTLNVTDYNCNSSGSVIGEGDLTEIYMYDGTNYRSVVYSSSGRRENYLTKQTNDWKEWSQYGGDKWTGSVCVNKMAENRINESLTYLNTYNSMESEKDFQKYVPYEYEDGKYVRKDETYVTFWIRDEDGRLTGAYDKRVTISQVIVEFDNRALVSVTLTSKHADKQGSPTGYGFKEYKYTFDTQTIQLPYGVK